MLEQSKLDSSHAMGHYILVYRIEPMGHVLLGWLRLPLTVIWFLFVFLNFGIRLIMHSIVGTPRPASFRDIFRAPSTFYYYPNLIAITFDLIGIPLIITMLVFFRDYIPEQLTRLEQSGLINEKPTTTKMTRTLHALSTNNRIQFIAIAIIPFLVAILGLFVDIWLFSPQDAPAIYALFQSLFGRYARMAIVAQIIYVFLILSNYRFDFRLHFFHPDECSGLAPFGSLAIAGYAYLFIHAMMQAIGTVAGGTGFERVLTSATGSVALIYLWLIFPIALSFIFSNLIYKPHRILQKTQSQYLWNTSTAWTKYHQQLTSSITRAVDRSEKPFADKSNFNFSDDLELLEIWSKLNKYVEDMHTWPIPKRTFQTIAILANPLIPLLLPVVVDVVRNLFP